MTEEKEINDEQKKKIEENKKTRDDIRKRYLERLKKEKEAQKNPKKAEIEMTLKQLDISQKIIECKIKRVNADCEVIEKVDLEQEQNEIKKNALKAKLGEMQASIDDARFKLEMINLNRPAVKKQLEELDEGPSSGCACKCRSG
jgi:hypothetical protein